MFAPKPFRTVHPCPLFQFFTTLRFIQGLSYEQFVVDKRTFNAVVRSLKVIGEAAKNVPDEIRERYPLVPWKEMAGMGDKVIHFYFGVDREAVWIAVKDRIPAVKPLIE